MLPFCLQESLNSGSYDIMERGDDDDEKSKKVTIGKTTEIPYKFSRKNTLLGNNSWNSFAVLEFFGKLE